jgi:hypothetical protein
VINTSFRLQCGEPFWPFATHFQKSGVGGDVDSLNVDKGKDVMHHETKDILKARLE